MTLASAELFGITQALGVDLKEAAALHRTLFPEYERGEKSSREIRDVQRSISLNLDLFAIAIYCLCEWPEPGDSEPDANSEVPWSKLRPDSFARTGLLE